MVAFILTRSFAISALVAGAFTVAYAVPVPEVTSIVLSNRGCRQAGCLFAVPSASDTQSAESTTTLLSPSTTATTAVTTSIAARSATAGLDERPDVIEAIAHALYTATID